MARFRSLVAALALAVATVACSVPVPPDSESDPLVRSGPDWLVRASSVELEGANFRSAADGAARGEAEPAAAIGLSGLPGLGARSTGTRPAQNEYSSASAVVPAAEWQGLQSIGPFLSSVTSDWPRRSLDFRIRSQLHPTARDGGHEWVEMLLATVDEVQDYFEPAYVQLPTGIHFGVDFMHDQLGDRSEETWLTESPLPDPHGMHDHQLVIDGDAGTATLWIDGALFETGVLPASNFGIVAPPIGHDLWMARRTIGVESMELRDGRDGPVVHSYDLSGAVDGDLEVSTATDDWRSASGMVVAPWTDGPRLISSGEGNHEVGDGEFDDIGADESFTWSARWRVWGDAASRISGATGWWHNFGESDPTNSPGWGVASYPELGVAYGFVISSGDDFLTVDAGALPEGEHVLTVRLDRSDATLSLWIDGQEVDSADASDLGAVSSSQPAALLGFGATADAKWFAMWDRGLTNAEIRAIANGES